MIYKFRFRAYWHWFGTVEYLCTIGQKSVPLAEPKAKKMYEDDISIIEF